MKSNQVMSVNDKANARLMSFPGIAEGMGVKGVYNVKCFDKDGKLKWEDKILNVVATVGKNLELDTLLAGSSYSVTGPFMGLISSVSYTTGPAAGDTMSSHGGWTEAGPTNAPNYSENRGTMSFNSASGGVKDLSANVVFTFSEGGTVKGCFVVLGSGAVNTQDSTAGTLYSAGVFSGGDKVVASTDVLNVDWQVTLT